MKAAFHVERALGRPWFVVFCLLTVPFAPLAWAQASHCAGPMEMQDQTPPGKLPPPQKMTGIGNVEMKITATPEAQMWFNQGLNLLHDFWDYESARAFEQSVRVDPQCAMCYWGLYEAESFYHSMATGYAGPALANAVSLQRHATKRERLYIEAAAAREESMEHPGPNAFAQEVTVMRKLVRMYPADTQARIFLAQVVDHKESVELLQSVLKQKPDDSAANHYYIHALEATDHPEQALHSAEILPSLAPASGHMVHMPGHIFFRTGDYARAERAFTASMQVDERYMEEQHVAPDNDWNYVHNLMYAVANLMEEGKMHEATDVSMKLSGARGKLESTLYIYSTRDSIARLDPRLPVALRTADWPKALTLLNARQAQARQPNLEFLARQLTKFAAGMQAIETRDVAKADELSREFDAELWRKSQESTESPGINGMMQNEPKTSGPPKLKVMPDALLQPLMRTLSVMSLELRASLLMAQGKTNEAKPVFANAAKEERALGYREPPIYIRPVGETQGAAMLAAGGYADAKAAYQQALLERPRSGLVLYGIAISSEKAGDIKAAAKEYADFLTVWKNADPGLSQLAHAQTYVAEHSATTAALR